MKLNIEEQISTEDFSGVFQELVDSEDITSLLVIADRLVGGAPGLAASVQVDDQPQLFKLVPLCTCESCLAIAEQDDVDPCESVLRAFLGYVKSRLVIMNGPGKGRVH